LIIRPPRELFMPMGTGELKADVLEAVYRVALDASTAKGRAAQVRTTIEWLGKAWWNTERITWPERIVYIKTGFEALTGTSKSRESARNLRLKRGGTPHVEREDGKSDGSRRLVHGVCVCAKRDHSRRGRRVAQVSDAGNELRWRFFSTGESVLRAAIKVALHTLGYHDLWQSEIHRAVVAAMKAAEAQEGSGTAGA